MTNLFYKSVHLGWRSVLTPMQAKLLFSVKQNYPAFVCPPMMVFLRGYNGRGGNYFCKKQIVTIRKVSRKPSSRSSFKHTATVYYPALHTENSIRFTVLCRIDASGDNLGKWQKLAGSRSVYAHYRVHSMRRNQIPNDPTAMYRTTATSMRGTSRVACNRSALVVCLDAGSSSRSSTLVPASFACSRRKS